MNEESADRARPRSLGNRERRVHDELYRLDPRLADLFVRALEDVQRLDEPAAIHMLSHAGREISNAVIRILSGEGETITTKEGDDSQEQESKREEDSQRRRIALVLDLPEQHPSVSTWARAHNALVRTTHFGAKAPSAESVDEAVRAFRALIDILLGRIGLYFEAREEIDALLRIEEPTTEQVERLQALASRPQLRHAFFHQLQHLGWLEPLTKAGLLAQPPDVRTDADTGELTAPLWPEAAYLERVAPEAPDSVVKILRALPEDNSNPVVWRAMADVALRLPPEHAARLIPMLQNALLQTTHPMVSRGVFSVAEMLAKAGDGNALELIRALLRVESRTDEGPLSLTETGQAADLPAMAPTARPEQFLVLVESVARPRATASVAMLCDVLHRMLVIEFGEPPSGAVPVHDHSQHWHGHVEDDEDRSAKSLITAATLRAALAAAASGEAGDAYVLQRLSRYPWQIFQRLRLAFLAQRPVVDQQALDAAIGDEGLLNEPYLLPEYRQLLKTRLVDASAAVRQSIVDRILRGPAEDLVKRRAGDDAEAATSFRDEWQRHRLRMFGDEPPAELRELASRLGTIGEKLSKAERDMDQQGFSVEVGVGGGPTSPLSAEDVSGITPEQLIEYLAGWSPERGRYAATPAGLASVIAGRVQEDSAWATIFLRKSRDANVDPTYLRGALDGLQAARQSGQQIPWGEALEFVEWVVSRPPEDRPTESPALYFDYRDPGFELARRIAAEFLRDSAQHNNVPDEHRERLWNAAEALIRAEATWVDAGDAPGTMEGVLDVELNTLGGKAALALLEVALNDYRSWKASNPGSDVWQNRERLRTILSFILEQRGKAAIAARSAIGRLLPQIMLLDHEWVDSHRPQLFEGGIDEPFRNPTFATYVVRASVHGQSFGYLRPLYEEAVAATARSDNRWTAGPESFRPGRHLLWHLVLAYHYGWLELGRDDGLLDAAFTNSNPEDSARVWWQFFRSWSDADEVSSGVIDRVTALLQWRLERLEEEGRDRKQVWEEARGFAWLAMADKVADHIMLPLLLRAVRLSKGDVPIAGALWQRLARMAAVNVHQATETAVLVIEAELRGEYPHFNFEELAPVLRVGLASENTAARELASRAIHTLGERGFEQFGTLLQQQTDGQR